MSKFTSIFFIIIFYAYALPNKITRLMIQLFKSFGENSCIFHITIYNHRKTKYTNIIFLQYHAALITRQNE